MFINYKEKTLIYTPFKNGSNSLGHVLNKHEGWVRVLGENPRFNFETPRIGFHTNILPTEAVKFKKILILRNPYNRVLSQWKYANSFRAVGFSEWFYKSSKQGILMPVAKCYKYNVLVRLENIDVELKQCDINIDDLPKLNVSSPDIQHELSELEKELIYFNQYDDFLAGGYRK